MRDRVVLQYNIATALRSALEQGRLPGFLCNSAWIGERISDSVRVRLD